MSLKLHFIRHGETTHSKKGGYCGALNPELTEKGQKMAEQFKEFLANLEICEKY